MTIEEIEALVLLAQTRDLATFEVSFNGASLRLTFGDAEGAEGNATASVREETPQAVAQSVDSPAVGVFRARHPLETGPGNGHAEASTPIAYIQSGPLLFAARAPAAGQIGKALVEEGMGVGFGTKLFEIA